MKHIFPFPETTAEIPIMPHLVREPPAGYADRAVVDTRHLPYLPAVHAAIGKLSAIMIVREDALPCVPPAGNVVDSVLVMYPQRAGHAAK